MQPEAIAGWIGVIILAGLAILLIVFVIVIIALIIEILNM